MSEIYDIDLRKAIGKKVKFEYYCEFGCATVTGTLIDTTPGDPFDHCRILVDEWYDKLPDKMTISSDQILNREELVGISK